MKKLVVRLSDEAWNTVESTLKEAGNNFTFGPISYSDVINEMVMTSKVDVKALQLKHMDLRRTLRVLAAKEDLDVETAFEFLSELKTRPIRKGNKTQPAQKETA